MKCKWKSQSCPTLCDPVDYTVHGALQAEYWSGQPFLSPGVLPNPGIEPWSVSSLQADSLPSELPGKQWCIWLFLKLTDLSRHGLGALFCVCAEAPLCPGWRRFWSPREAPCDIPGDHGAFWLSYDSLLSECTGITNQTRTDQWLFKTYVLLVLNKMTGYSWQTFYVFILVVLML